MFDARPGWHCSRASTSALRQSLARCVSVCGSTQSPSASGCRSRSSFSHARHASEGSLRWERSSSQCRPGSASIGSWRVMSILVDGGGVPSS